MFELPHLIWGTITLRPYVFAFLAVYLLAGTFHMGWKRTLVYIPVGYSIAWMSEFASIHWGFPYGDYYYIHDTMGRELWVFGVPFMDSLSYVFLSYCSYSLATALVSPNCTAGGHFHVLETRSTRRSLQTLVLGSFLFVFLDILTDPVALQGYRWFLGQIYGYNESGVYFGVPMSNFAGWLVVGFVMIATLQGLDRASRLELPPRPFNRSFPEIRLVGPVLYFSVLVFNLVVTFHINEDLMGTVGCFLVFYTFLMAGFFTLYKVRHVTSSHIALHLTDFPELETTALRQKHDRLSENPAPPIK